MRCVVATRLRRAAPMTVLRGKDSDYSGIYAELGFQFDGFSEYRRPNNDTVKSSIYVNPTFYNMTEAEAQISDLAYTLTLRGSRLNGCCSISDYVVYLGDEVCPIEYLLSKQIICTLPKSWKLSGPAHTRDVTVSLIEMS